MSHSNNYNPFNYVYDKNGEMNKTYVMKMVNCLMKNTKQEGSSGGDQFWDDSTKALTLAIAFYLLEKKDAKDASGKSLDRNFSTVMKMMRLAEISEQDENHRSPLDDMMDELREENPMSMAVSYYADFKKAPAETAKSILISAAVRFAAFNLPEVADLTHTDNIHLDTLGDKKTALFVIIPSSDATFNFLAAMMYTQLFDTLYDTANFKYGGRLPVHVRCLLDEFANIGTIPDFDKLLATMRSMEISANIIIQNLAQLKKMYPSKITFYGGLYINTDTNEWYCFSQADKHGGRNAINCLTDILGMDFKTAVEALTGENISYGVYKPTEQPPPKPRELIIPERAESMRNVFAYLCKARKIDSKIVSDLAHNGLLYQDKRGNAVFLHIDDNGEILGAELQGTNTYQRFKGVAAGTADSVFSLKVGTPTFKGHCGFMLFDITQTRIASDTTVDEKAVLMYLRKI